LDYDTLHYEGVEVLPQVLIPPFDILLGEQFMTVDLYVL
jgi:hypothetical protein